MDKQEFLDALNSDLESEYRSIVQYIQHISYLKGARFQQTAEELQKHLDQELNHALTLAKQIDFLGGTASNEVASFDTVTEPESALRQDLSLEVRQLDRYRNRVEQAHELGLPDVAEALAPLLKETQDHIHDLRTALDS